MKRELILVTGFERFGMDPANPTADLALELDGAVIGGKKVKGLILPVTYADAFRVLMEAVHEHKPSRVVAFGLHAGAHCFRLERIGVNKTSCSLADNNQVVLMDGKIDLEGPDHLEIATDLLRLQSLLYGKGIVTDISTDAGAFICNLLIYRAAQVIKDFSFIHTPWPVEYKDQLGLKPGHCPVTKAQLRMVAETIISYPDLRRAA